MSYLLLMSADSSQNHVANNHENKRGQKNDPTRKLVEKTFRGLWAKVIREKASAENADGIADDCDWDHQDWERITHPASTVG
jgi:hypothetical protein